MKNNSKYARSSKNRRLPFVNPIQNAMVVLKLLRMGLTHTKLERLNNSSSENLAARSGSEALELARSEDWETLQHSRFTVPNTEVAARAFWVNLYNTLTLHAMYAANVETSVLEKPGFFNRFAYRVSGLEFTLNDIEHGVLRGNRGAFLMQKPFSATDPRLKFVLPLDPRIHFALNCGAVSCPPIRAYETAKLEAQLELAAQSYLSTARTEGNTVWLPRILSYYAADFGDPLEFARRYKPELPARGTVKFDPYDWNIPF
jgi:Protein of unknown function, DUF547